MIWLRLMAKSSVNGNPRRLSVLIDGEGEIRRVVDEGCTGKPLDAPGFPIPVHEVTVPLYEYDRWRARALQKGVLHVQC